MAADRRTLVGPLSDRAEGAQVEGVAVVAGQRWTDLVVPELGAWQPTERVAIVLPARDNQPELDRTLAALAHQTYPQKLMEVVVVDDASHPALTVPDIAPPGTRVVRRDEVSSHGSGPARHAGALATGADILLFLDSDMLADLRHVEAHSRWHHVCRHAVVLGHKWFVDVEGITPEAIRAEARRSSSLAGLFDGRQLRRHGWQEEHVAAQDNLTHDVDDVFLTVVGATVSVRRDFYERCGGFSAFGLRGIVDTEFGYRAFTLGGLIVPEWSASSWHQGARTFSTRGDEVKRARTGLAANYLPHPLFRTQNVGRQWAVPGVRVLVDVSEHGPGQLSDEQAEILLVTVDAVLASDETDLAVTVVSGDAEVPSWWYDYVAHDCRVTVERERPTSGFPSPVTVVLPPGAQVSSSTVSQGVLLLGEEARVVRTLPDEYGTPSVEIWRTRTLERARAVAQGADGRLAQILGERWCPARSLGVSRVRVRTTPQGMVAHW